MSPFDTVIGSLSGAQLTLNGLLAILHRQGRLEPLIREALADQFLQEHARRAGLSFSAEELQTAADDFRRRKGLLGAADSNAWLASQRLSLDNFQSRLESLVLPAKVARHLTSADVDRYFADHQADFERVRLAQVVVGREDVARELTSQIREEGRELADLAQEHGLKLARLECFRQELKGPLATAKTGQLVGPVSAPGGIVLVLIEACRPAELDAITRHHIQEMLAAAWLTANLREATIDLTPLGLS